MLVPEAVLLERCIIPCLEQFDKNGLYVYDGNTLFKSTDESKDDIKGMIQFRYTEGKWRKIE